MITTKARRYRLRPGQPLIDPEVLAALSRDPAPASDSPPSPPYVPDPAEPAPVVRASAELRRMPPPGGPLRALSALKAEIAGHAVAPDPTNGQGLHPASGLDQSQVQDQAQGRSQDPVAAPMPVPIPTVPPPAIALPPDPAVELRRIGADLRSRRRAASRRLTRRFAALVLLPTLLGFLWWSQVATPLYATHSEFVIQKAEPAGAAAGFGGLFAGTSMATQQDSLTVQSFLTSRAALRRLEADHGFRAHFADPGVDPLRRLRADAGEEETYALYRKIVKVTYDPTQGIVRLDVAARDPATSLAWSQALLGYAEEQVDDLTRRAREDQMRDARDAYDEAEARRETALQDWLEVQGRSQQMDPVGETAARTHQISALETERQRLEVALSTRLSVEAPNQAQVDALRSQIANIETLIADLRAEMTTADAEGSSLASASTELRLAEENYTFQTMLVQQALQQMEMAQIEANRQVRYLSLGVEPVPPDRPTLPHIWRNTLLTFLVAGGLALMGALTGQVLREQMHG